MLANTLADGGRQIEIPQTCLLVLQIGSLMVAIYRMR